MRPSLFEWIEKGSWDLGIPGGRRDPALRVGGSQILTKVS